MAGDDTFAPPQEPVRAPTLTSPTLLGLYTLLLAFFILLVTISTHSHDRARDVFHGVGVSFNPDYAAGAGAMPIPLPANEAPTPGFIAEAGRLVAGAMPLSRVEDQREGRSLRVVIPMNALFAPDSAEPRQEALSMLGMLAALVAARPPGIAYEIEITSERARGAAEMPIARAGALRERLVAGGAPADAVIAGLATTMGENARFAFAVRQLAAGP